MAKPLVILTGDKKLNRALAKLANKDARAIVRKAARPALRPVLASAKRHAPKATGALAHSLKIRAIKRSRTRVGAQVQTAAGSFKGETFYGGFQEWGWKQGKRGRLFRKHIEGAHFLIKAANETRAEALRIYRGLIAYGLREFARRNK